MFCQAEKKKRAKKLNDFPRAEETENEIFCYSFLGVCWYFQRKEESVNTVKVNLGEKCIKKKKLMR